MNARVIAFPAPRPAIVRWYDAPAAQALLASLTKRQPDQQHFRDDWQQGFEYIGSRVDHLRKLYDRFGEEVQSLCHAAFDAIGPDAPQAAVDAAYAPFVAWSQETVDAVIDRALGRDTAA
jgi:hypothetical protein